MIDLLLYPVLAACILCLASGPLGAFVVWRRGAYFGETIAHSALLGVGLALLLDLAPSVGIFLACAACALLIGWMETGSTSRDTLLGILAQASLAIGVIIISLVAYKRVDLSALLLGDILTVTAADVLMVVAVVAGCLLVLFRYWSDFVMLCVSEELAKAEGLSSRALSHGLNLCLAMLIAVSVKIVGVLLIGALLIVTAAAARRISSSPEAMALYSGLIGVMSVVLGLTASNWVEVPAGPAIVCAALLFFVASLFKRG